MAAEVSRRRLFGLLAGAAAVPLVAPVPPALYRFGPSSISTVTNLSADLVSITRSVFVARVAKQLYTQNPLISLIMKGD